jgi:hypothetical protein
MPASRHVPQRWEVEYWRYLHSHQRLDDENLKTYVIDRVVAKREELRKAKNQEPEPLLICKKKVTIPDVTPRKQ